jgi:hypothetical protein
MRRSVFLSLLPFTLANLAACGGLNNDPDLGRSQPYRLSVVDAPSSTYAGDCDGNYMSIQVVQKTNGTTIFVNDDVVVTAKGYADDTEVVNSVFLQPLIFCTGQSSNTTIADGKGEALIYLQVTRVEVNRIRLTTDNPSVGETEFDITVVPNFLGAISLENLPSTAVVGQDFSPAPTLQLTDAWGNTISDETANITLLPFLDSICASPASGTLTGDSGTTSSAGTLTLPNVRYSPSSIIYIKAIVTGEGTIGSECKGPITVNSP